MWPEQKAVRWLYGKLLCLYPRGFRERFGESMLQTFDDLYNERLRQSEQGVFGFVLWLFLETGTGILRERLLFMWQGAFMQSFLKRIGLPALIGLLIILPFMIMQVVNRRSFNEGFPFALFFILWLNLFAISIMLLPIVQGRVRRPRDMAGPAPAQGTTLLTDPRPAAMISVGLFLCTLLLIWLQSLGWPPLERLINGPNPPQPYFPGQLVVVGILLLPVAAGVVAGGPIAHTLQAGGRLLAHPLHLLIVATILILFIAGFAGLMVDQWPCFMGVPNCD